MAEIVGVVSGAITLADASHKAGSGILALKRLWNDIHNVPDYINSLLDRLGLVHLVLTDLQAELSRDQNILNANSAVQLSVQYCSKAIKNLDTLVNELRQRVEDKQRLRRNKARVKVVLEKDAIQRLEREVQDAFQLLGIAQQTYSVALVRHQPSLITNQIGALGIAASPSITQGSSPRNQKSLTSEVKTKRSIEKPANTGFLTLSWVYSSLFGSYTSKSSLFNLNGTSTSIEETYCARVQLPSWLARSVWDICAKRASNGWTYSLKHWTIRPQDTEVFETAFRSDISSVIQMFKSRTGSLYDRDTQGWTLLHYAAFEGDLEKFTYLVQKGLSVHETDNKGATPLYFLCRIADQGSDILNVYRFLRYTDDITDAANTLFNSSRNDDYCRKSTLHRFIWSVPGLLDLLLEEFHLAPIESRFESLVWRYVDTKVLLDLIVKEKLTDAENIRQQLYRSSVTSLHGFAKVYFQSVPGGPNIEDLFGQRLRTAFADWRKLARWLFRGISTKDLSRQGNEIWEATTPLFAGLLDCGWKVRCSPSEVRQSRGRLNTALAFWLEDLRSAGVDLERYGKREQRKMFLESYMLQTARWKVLACGEGNELNEQGPILVSIKYGPRPSDWELIWDGYTETFVGTFFEWVEQRRPLMPGSWEEDDMY
ncbi:uncharacterized protein BDV17DRAFT_298910 [Aspergillus undulatus]|uniref:uncharacterized protein n=1 Tax=Aspergillus undulatus TaxID=1810928 RepID=UPI003CCCD839